MAKIWLKIWLKVKENGTKKIKLAKMVAKEKEILVRTLWKVQANFILILYNSLFLLFKARRLYVHWNFICTYIMAFNLQNL